MSPTMPSEGPDLLGAMVDAAANRARGDLPGALRLARCEQVQLNEGFAAPDVSIETWPVRQDRHTITISVFATAPRGEGGHATAATGRFTFTTLSHRRDTGA
ncbi:hypothetical protein [Novosphingobium terrae]|uniref:hypothetical protein n=1 Tax=Novosphingobium terrae TaxID=2726189 RepID=UPI0019803397|nr:hypothetical protein [Novosphingobium terrae]